MNKFFVLLFIFHQTLFENLVFVSLKPTDPFLETIPGLNETIHPLTPFLEPSAAKSSNKRYDDLEHESIDKFSGTCPNSGCRGTVADFHDYNPPKSGCYCDETCIGLRDCCTDSVFYDEEEQRKPPTLDCVYDLPSETEYYVDRGCPRSWKNEEFVEKCAISRKRDYNTADLRLMVPVTSLSTGNTYGNVFCALCNGEYNFVIWRMIIINYCTNTPKVKKRPGLYDSDMHIEKSQLRNSSDLKFNGQHWYFEEFEKEYVCSLILHKPSEKIELKSCKQHPSFKTSVIDSCPKDWTDVTVLNQCKGAYALVYHNSGGKLSKKYKNKFCAYCNGLNDTQLFCRPTSYAGKSSTFGYAKTDAIPVTFEFNMSISDTEFCRRTLTKGKNLTATEKRLCPTDALKTQLV